MDGSVTALAPAKLNLSLSVGPPEASSGERPGWHRISSLMVTADLHDEVVVSRSSGEPSWDVVWHPDAPRRSAIDWERESDLAWRAVQGVRALAPGDAPDLDVLVTKRIPVGGGLGGGTSDAAAAAIAASRVLGMTLDAPMRASLAASLGSDATFLLEAFAGGHHAAIVSGFGEVVEPVALAWTPQFVLFVPGFACDTGAIYRAYDAAPEARDDAIAPGLASTRSITEMSSRIHNSLEAPAFGTHPDLGVIADRLERETGAPIHMSGSGSTLFALSHDADRDARMWRGFGDSLGVRVIAARMSVC